MNFTNSNVKDGSFVYAGSPKTSRFTTALVRYVDKYENFKPKVEYVEDAAGIIKYGLIEKELIAFGCTSRGQARRLGKWFLFSAQLETDSIQFTAGKEASYLRPGDVVKVIDRNKTRKRYGGRIVNVSNSAKQITLDGEVNENVVGQIMTIAIPSSFETEETLDQRASKKRVSDQDLANLRRPQIKEFKVSSVDTDNLVPSRKTILGLTSKDDSEAEEIGKIKPGAIWVLQNDDADLQIRETLFRVMNIEEENPMEYKISCLEYNKSKFKASEDDSQADASNVSAIAIGGSGQIEQSQSQTNTDQGADEKQDEDSGLNKYQVPVESIIVSHAAANEFVPEKITVTWVDPKEIADGMKYRISIGILSQTVDHSNTTTWEIDAKDKNGQIQSNVSFYPFEKDRNPTGEGNRMLSFAEETSVKNTNQDYVLDVTVTSVVDGKVIRSINTTWDKWGG
jgi:predicted phage tail protein